MELELNHLMAVLPRDDRDLVEEFLQALNTGSSAIVAYHKRLKQLVERQPYPTLQILQLCCDKSKFQIERIMSEALYQLLTDNQQVFSTQFISYLANFPVRILDAPSLRVALMETLTTQLPLNDRVFLAVLSRPETNVLEQLLVVLKKRWLCCQRLPFKEFVLLQCYEHRQHFAPLVSLKLTEWRSIDDLAVRNNLLILRTADELSSIAHTPPEVANIAKWLEEFDMAATPQDLCEIHRFFYADFQRICLVLDFLRKYPDTKEPVQIQAILDSTGILELLYKYEICANYDNVRRIIEATYKWQQQIPALKCVHEVELETLNYYTALSTVYDVVVADARLNLDVYYAGKMVKLNTLLRQIRNVDVLCSLIEDIFQMVFLRWEHLRSNTCIQPIRARSSKSTSSSSASSGSLPEKIRVRRKTPPAAAGQPRKGFVCRGRALYSLFSYLRNFVTKKLHSEDYKLSSERLQMRFQRIVEVISEALWKYSVLEKIDESLMSRGAERPCVLESEELLQLVHMHPCRKEKSSSDDESRDRFNYASLTRRKAAKKRARANSIVSDSGGNSATALQATVAADTTTQQSSDKPTVRLTECSIIPKMLCSPDNLALMALSLNNFNDVKHIIENFNLQNSELNRELSYVEQQQQVIQKLASIYANYLQQEERENGTMTDGSRQRRATVEQIQSVAAKGFEVSKIISVIDNFAQSQRLQQTAERKQLLLKYNHNARYAFLRQFDERNLNTVIIFDLIANLPFNRDITSSVLMVIRRQQQVCVDSARQCGGDDQTSANGPIRSHEMGAMPLLENLCECLRLLGGRLTLRELLCDNYYALRPRKLAAELDRERAFLAVFYKTPCEISSFDDLKAYSPLFQPMQAKCNYYARFNAYVGHLARLLQLRDRNQEYHSSELLKNDPCTVIGELIFECNMTPLEIQANVAALNLNLVHVIALNICPEIAGRPNIIARIPSAQKQETVLNYVSDRNHLLAYLLHCINGRLNDVHDEHISSQFLERCLRLPEIDKLAALYGGNRIVAALRLDSLNLELVQKLGSKLQQVEILTLHIGHQDAGRAQAQLLDKLVVELIEKDATHISLAAQVHDIALRANLILANFTNISSTRLAKELIESTLQHKEAATHISGDLRAQLETTLADVTVYAKVSEVLQFETWPQAYDFGQKTPNAIFERLLQLHLYKLCYKWCQVVRIGERFAQHKRTFFVALLNALLELNDSDHKESANAEGVKGGVEVNHYLLLILQTFPTADCVVFLDAHKDKFRSLGLLQYVVVEFLAKQKRNDTCGETDNCYKNYKISLTIFEQLSPGERDQFWPLLRFPLLIMEQLIMNAKFETLSNVLGAVRRALQQQPSADGGDSVCGYCFDKRGHIYDVHAKASANAKTPASSPRQKQPIQLGGDSTGADSAESAFMLLSFNLYQEQHVITNDCIDLLLRIYATKALDYHISDANASTEQLSQLTDLQQSLDSLCGAFQTPAVAPSRNEWVRDEDATHCMCCRRAAFTMLMRRHHCRRCGRVICFACSAHRMRIPELYAEVEVRVCSDCHRHAEQELLRSAEAVNNEGRPSGGGLKQAAAHGVDTFKWKLSGNITHDKLLREEFCYEHAPSVALCLSILGYHLGREKCVELLLYHCRKLEKLIVPNPEVDYELVAKMINCLAVAAQVRGGPAEGETIREHSEIVMSVVQSGCAALIPPGPLNNHSLRKLADSLVQAEKWQLALEVHLKCGIPTAGVMAAHGLACLRAGCYDTAREKFAHCMPRLSSEAVNTLILGRIMSPHASIADSNDNPSSTNTLAESGVPCVKRPQRGPPLLQEILRLIETTPFVRPQPETLHRASVMRSSNNSLASRRNKRYTQPMHEPAMNVLTTLGNLSRIASGHYDSTGHDSGHLRSSRPSHNLEECMHYALSYGSHADIMQFLMRHHELAATLRYYALQQLDPEHFVQHVFLAALHCGQVPALIEQMRNCDARLMVWRKTLLQTCRYLEQQQLLNSLYQLQQLLNDPVRACMTCVKFYTMKCENFQQLHANAHHLHNAHKHLQSQLELAQWENVDTELVRRRKSSVTSRRTAVVNAASSMSSVADAGSNFLMQMDARSLNAHINTLLNQLEVAKFLANCERENSSKKGLVTERILRQIRLEAGKLTLPTLFDGTQDKIQICILLLYCGKNIEEGFGLAYRVMQDIKVPPMKVFAATAKYLARNQRLPDVEKLLSCITSNNGVSTGDIDELLSIAINSATNSHEPDVKTALDNLTKRINSIELRISCNIFIGQLKSAYLLAIKYERLADIRRILRHADLTNQIHIKKLCEKKLNLSASQGEQS